MAKAKATPARIPTYFSHSYHASDREVNRFFWKLFQEHGFMFSVDPKSAVLSVAYLEHMMRRSACFVAVITRRNGQPPDYCSPFILFEYGLAVRAQKPRLVFVEEGVPARYFPRRGHEVHPFKKSGLGDDAKAMRDKVRTLVERARPYRGSDTRLAGDVGILLGDSTDSRQAYPRDLRTEIEKLVRRTPYTPRVVDLRFDKDFELSLQLDAFDALILDVTPGFLPGWVFPLVYGRFIPALKLYHHPPGGAPPTADLPPLIAGQLMRGEAGADDDDGESVTFWNGPHQLLAALERQLARFSTERTEFRTLEEGEKYFRHAGRVTTQVFVSNAGDANGLAKPLSARLSLENMTHFHYQARNTITLGDEWEQRLPHVVEQSGIFVMLVTREYWKSSYCRAEYAAAQKQRALGKMTIVPYFLEPVPDPALPTQGRDLAGVPPERQVQIIAEDLDMLLTTGHAAGMGESGDGRAAPAPAVPVAVDIAVVTIIKEEYDAVVRLLARPVRDPGSHDSPNLYGWQLGEVAAEGREQPYRVAVAMAGQAGNVSGAKVVIETLDRWKPRYVLLVGIAGGFHREGLAKGDVVVSKVIWGYEYGKIEGEFKPRNDFTYIVDTPLTVAAETVSDNWVNKIAPAPPVPGVAPKVVLGPVASGDKVVDDVTNSFFQKVLNHFPKLVAVEMEGAGAAAAIQSAREKGRSVGFVMIRGISDMPVAGDGAAPTRAAAGGGSDAGGAGSGQTQQRDRWKKFAAAAAATFAVRLIQEAWPVPPAAEA